MNPISKAMADGDQKTNLCLGGPADGLAFNIHFAKNQISYKNGHYNRTELKTPRGITIWQWTVLKHEE